MTTEPTVDVARLAGDPVAERRVEVVERKGLGHPDTLCDGVAEAVSRALSRRYREEFGRVLHHNVDKVSLHAGASEPAYGGGSVTEPVTLVIGGRATRERDGVTVPVADLATDAARAYVAEVAPAFPPDMLEVDVRVGETSNDLAAVFRSDVPRANDTSVGVGYAPLSETERIVRTLEPRVREVPGVGPDVKVMGARRGDSLRLTIAAAVLGSAVTGPAEYRETVERVREVALAHARERTDRTVDVRVNAADDPDDGDVYLTVTGLSAEMGDDGAVGRGNRVNGLIAPARPTSLEAAAGKNPVTHVGKLYNALGVELAGDVAGEDGAYTEVLLLSEIGAPVTEPQSVEVRTAREDEDEVLEAVRDGLAAVPSLTDRLVAGEVSLF